jgi:hypothetical protein
MLQKLCEASSLIWRTPVCDIRRMWSISCPAGAGGSNPPF